MRPNSERATIVCLNTPATRAVDVIIEEAIDAAIRDLANEIIEFEAFTVLPWTISARRLPEHQRRYGR
jgi:hypothetical protein